MLFGYGWNLKILVSVEAKSLNLLPVTLRSWLLALGLSSLAGRDNEEAYLLGAWSHVGFLFHTKIFW